MQQQAGPGRQEAQQGTGKTHYRNCDLQAYSRAQRSKRAAVGKRQQGTENVPFSCRTCLPMKFRLWAFTQGVAENLQLAPGNS